MYELSAKNDRLTKAVVMLCNENDIVHTRLVCGSYPLISVDCTRSVTVNGKLPVRPLGIVKGVYSKMDKHSEFAFNLRKLILIWFGCGYLLNRITVFGIRFLFSKKHNAPHNVFNISIVSAFKTKSKRNQNGYSYSCKLSYFNNNSTAAASHRPTVKN